MQGHERATLAGALAVALGSAAVVPLYADMQWVPKGAGGIGTVAVAGMLTRRANVPGILQPPAAVMALFAYVCAAFAPASLAFGLVPTGETVVALNDLLRAGLADIERLAPPVPSSAGLTLIAVLGLAAIAIVVDLFAVVLGRAAAAGLPLLVLFALPSVVLPGGLGWVPFVFVAAGWLCLMLVEGGDRVSRWGTPLNTARPDRSTRYDDTGLGRVGRRIGAAALSVAVIVPAMIPGLDERLVGGSRGDGIGKGSRTSTTYNPITKLRDDLRLPSPRDILTYRTNKTPDYLRMTTLDRFTDAGWSSSRLSASTSRDGLRGRLPAPRGLPAATSEEVQVQIRIRTLDAQWLPVPPVPSRVRVDGAWLYDETSETVFSTRTSTRMIKNSYTVTAIRPRPDPALLANTTSSDDDGIQNYAVDPGDEVTSYVRDLTAHIVRNARNDYEKAAAIQAYFIDTGNGFRYTESTTVPGIESASALEAFLRGKRGFCEQFASSMAVMMRIAGLPARVAIGFTAGTLEQDGQYRVTTDNAHAWPEGWFAGTGWVRFEPTPRRDGQTTVPTYTLGAGAPAAGADPEDGGRGVPSGTDTAEEPQSAVQRKLDRLDDASVTFPSSDAGTAGPGRSGMLTLLTVTLLSLVVMLPRFLHALRRRRRWRAGGALAGWAQVRDDAVDLGHAWRHSESPRAAAATLAARYEMNSTARAALGRVSSAAERALYSRNRQDDQVGLRRDAAVVRAAMRGAVSGPRRWRAWLLPASTVGATSSAVRSLVTRAFDAVDTARSAVPLPHRRTRAV